MQHIFKKLNFQNKLALAPMAGYTYSAFRQICKEAGVGLLYTEMISSYALVHGDIKTLKMLEFSEIEHPIGVQIFGNDPEIMAKAAKILEKNYRFDFIDINFGCPAPKISDRGHSGSYLLKDLPLLKAIAEAVVKAVSIPVSAKIRLGFDKKSVNGQEVAKILENSGVAFIAVHGRTKEQGYSGTVDLTEIKKIKEAVSIPVIGNGDVANLDDFTKMLEYCKVDAVMIGRKALANPLVFTEILTQTPNLKTPTAIAEIILKHYTLLKNQEKDQKRFFLLLRGAILFYLKNLKVSSILRQTVCRLSQEEELFQIIEEIKKIQ